MSNKFSKKLRENERKTNVKINLSSDKAQPDIAYTYNVGERVVELDCNQIEPDKGQARKHYDPEKLKDLNQDIIVNGQLQPVIVRQDESGKLIIKYGERRWRAICLSGGKIKVKCIIVKDDKDLFNLRLAQTAENEMRENFDPIELASAYAEIVKLGEEKNLNKSEVAKLLHINRTKLMKYLAIANSPNLSNFIKIEDKPIITDVESLYNLALLEKENSQIFDDKDFKEDLVNGKNPVRDVISKYKNKKSSDINANQKEMKPQKITVIKNIDIEVFDNVSFILRINNKEFSLSKKQLDDIKKFSTSLK